MTDNRREFCEAKGRLDDTIKEMDHLGPERCVTSRTTRSLERPIREYDFGNASLHAIWNLCRC